MRKSKGGQTTFTRVSISAVTVACALLLLADAGGTPSAATCARDQPGQVRLIGHAPRPATIRISPGATVTWIACGPGNRRVTSDTTAWPTFTLRPNRSQRVGFPRPGRYSYRVDGKEKGTVVVAAAATTPVAGPERTVRYDIRVEARYTYRQSDGDGQVETTFAYVGTWRSIPVKIYDGFGTISVVAVDARGTVDATLTFADDRGDTRCRGTLDYPSYAARANLSASRTPSRPAHTAFGSSVVDSSPYEKLTDVRTAACDDLPASDARTVWLGGPFKGADGVTIRPPGAGVGEMDADFVREGGAGVPFPLDRLRGGKAFAIRGARSVGPQPCGTGCVESSTGRVAFVFTPRR